MAARKRWNDLNPRTRRLIIIAAAFEGALKIAALIDLTRRPRKEIRGPKAAWALAVSAVNGLGVAPIAYFRFGRKSSSS